MLKDVFCQECHQTIATYDFFDDQVEYKFECPICKKVTRCSLLETPLKKSFDGYEAAFKGAMSAYGKLAANASRWIRHVTGTGGDSAAHYWPKDCDTCKEIASFVEGWTR